MKGNVMANHAFQTHEEAKEAQRKAAEEYKKAQQKAKESKK